ncbi:MAG: 1-acyl-sn-glycerol-3-phosphate acyltransferase [Bacteroidales bacterium]|nr:1-acyl-sn-glycerol-3-phosphate acyltransferase [Bacteroidales bacterium]
MENTETTVRDFIDVERIIASKSEKALKYTPNFIIAYLKRIVHQDYINTFLVEQKDKEGLDFVRAVLDEFDIKLNIQGLDNIDREKRYIIAANHPIGSMDGIALMDVLGKVREDIIFPVNDLLMNIPHLQKLFIPINKHGSNIENARIIDRTFASKVMMLYFPAGLVSRRKKGVIEDTEWKKTFIRKSRDYKRDIVPTYIEGRVSSFFYRLANWRARLGIKINIEMLYLANEMFKQRGKEIKIIFGKPIPHQTFDRSKKDIEWAAYVKKQVYAINKKD